MENNEYLNSTKLIYRGLQFFGIFPFLSFHKGTQSGLSFSRLLVGLSMAWYFISFINETKLTYRTVSPLLANSFNFNFLVRLIPTTYARVFFLIVPFVTWKKSGTMHLIFDDWSNYQKELETLMGKPYKSTVKKKIHRTAIFLTLWTLLSCSAIKTDYTFYILIFNTHISSIAVGMLMYQFIFILWWANCKYVEFEARNIVSLIRTSMMDHSQTNLQQLAHLWNHLCDLNDKFNSSNAGLFVSYVSICVVDVVTLTYYSLYLYFVQGNTVAGMTFFLPGIFCIANIVFLYEAANSTLKQITSKIEEIILNNNITDTSGEKLRSIQYFLEVIEARNPEIDLSGYLTLDRAQMISIYAIIINYLIVLKQFATT